MKKVLLVGNCNFDGPRIIKVIESNFEAKVVEAKTLSEAKSILKKEDFDLILVNRIGAFDGKRGIELIAHVKSSGIKTPIMLVTNYKDKMQEAMEKGAVQGFGKTELGSQKTLGTLAKHLKKEKGQKIKVPAKN